MTTARSLMPERAKVGYFENAVYTLIQVY